MLIPEQTANKYMYIDSSAISQNELLASFEKATGAEMGGDTSRRGRREENSNGEEVPGRLQRLHVIASVHHFVSMDMVGIISIIRRARASCFRCRSRF